MENISPHALVAGAGPAGLMAAEALAAAGLRVTLCDAMASPARKFLLAGRGGLNLTHSEDISAFTARYGDAAQRLAPLVAAFSPADTRAWCEGLGEPTFIGSSGRVFPKSFKASPLLRAWLRRLAGLGVEFRPRHRFIGWDAEGGARFVSPLGETIARADAAVLAFGGASWPKLGSDGAWRETLASRGVALAPLLPSNCGFDVPWSEHLRQKFAGAPLKSIALSFAAHTVRGEALITEHGIEGGAVYALSPRLRDAIAAHGEALVNIDLRPDIGLEPLTARLSRPRGKQSAATFLRKTAGLEPVAVALLREAGALPGDAAPLAALIKNLPLRLTGARPIERAISSAGGVRFSELDEALMLKRMPGVFIAGEMIDWEAPTGGYLLQACLATGAAAGRGAAQWARRGGVGGGVFTGAGFLLRAML